MNPDEIDGLQVWLAGRNLGEETQWEALGLYATKEQAIERCQKWYDFVAPLVVGEDLPEETVDWSGVEYPLAERDEGGE